MKCIYLGNHKVALILHLDRNTNKKKGTDKIVTLNLTKVIQELKNKPVLQAKSDVFPEGGARGQVME